jgi:SpoVK/Ycf46/Vps4 family AAA+-type ATPase
LRVNATRDVLILGGAGATLVTIGVGTPVAGVYASYKCVQLVSEKIKRKMFYPKILEYLEPYEKDFSLSDVQGSKEFKNKLYTLVANIKAAAKNNEEINPITFFGEAGVGKTLMAKVVGAEMEKLGYRFVRFNITSLKDCHNPEDEVRRVFELTRKKKWILFIDEADQLLFLNRNSQKLNDKSRSLMMKVMEVTGGKMSGKFEGLILCSTNNLADVDEPMLQRFASKVIVFPKPDVDVVKQILQKNIQEQLFASLPVSRLQKICRFVTRKKPIFRNFEEGCFSLEHLDFLANKMLENKFSGRLIENYVSAIKTETGNTLFVNKELVDVCLDEAIASSAARGNLSERA